MDWEAVQKAQVLKPDLILLDIGLPRLSGIEASHRISQLIPTATILFVSQMSDADLVQEALSNGAKGCLEAGRGHRPDACDRSCSTACALVSSGVRSLV